MGRVLAGVRDQLVKLIALVEEARPSRRRPRNRLPQLAGLSVTVPASDVPQITAVPV